MRRIRATTLKEDINKRTPTQIVYAAESPFPCLPRGVLAYAHINKLMIIAKRENHTHKTYNKQKGKLEENMIYHTNTYNFIIQDTHVH